MKLSGFQKYFLLLMLSFGIAKGNNALSSIADFNSFSTATTLHENHKKSPELIVGEFVEEINNDENGSDAQADFCFIVHPPVLFTFNNIGKSLDDTPKNPFITITPNQKINVLNCTFLI